MVSVFLFLLSMGIHDETIKTITVGRCINAVG